MGYTSDEMEMIYLAGEALSGINASVCMESDPTTHDLMWCVQAPVPPDTTPLDVKEMILRTLRQYIGPQRVGVATWSASKGRGRRRRDGQAPAESVSVRVHLRGAP